MNLIEKISITSDVLEKIIVEEVKKNPGIDATKGVKIEISKDRQIFDIYVFPSESAYNLNDIAFELQKLVHYYISKQFDVKQIKVNIFLMRFEVNNDKHK